MTLIKEGPKRIPLHRSRWPYLLFGNEMKHFICLKKKKKTLALIFVKAFYFRSQRYSL